MTTITIEVDDESGDAFYSLSLEHKKQFIHQVTLLMERAVSSARMMKLKMINDQMVNGDCGLGLSPDQLLELLRLDEF